MKTFNVVVFSRDAAYTPHPHVAIEVGFAFGMYWIKTEDGTTYRYPCDLISTIVESRRA